MHRARLFTGGVSGRDTSHLTTWAATVASCLPCPVSINHPKSLYSTTENYMTLGKLHKLHSPQFIC